MSISRIILFFFACVAVAQAKPVITTSNVKSYLENVTVSIVVAGKWETFKVYADAFTSVSGEVRLANPKLVSGRDFYGIELDLVGASSPLSNAKAVLGIAQNICAAMELKPAVTRDGQLDTVVYPSLFKSLRVSIGGSNAVLHFKGQISDSKKPVISSIICE